MVGEGSSRGTADVSREASERLDLLEELVRKWNPAINLVSKDSLSQIRSRHISDSVQLFDLARPSKGDWCDLGSGGGFPGLVVAIMAGELSNPGTVKLVESDGRKAAFLREAVRQLGVNASVLNVRIEDQPPLQAGVLSARALASLSKLCSFAVRHLASDGTAFFPKGATYQSEIDAAQKEWAFDLRVHPSRTDQNAAILEVRNIRHV